MKPSSKRRQCSGKILEVNDHSFEYRKGSIANAGTLLGLCKKHGVRVAVSSDAHSLSHSKFDAAAKQLRQNDFSESLIVNLTMERFEGYLKERALRIKGRVT